jgi:hypothetical protein
MRNDAIALTTVLWTVSLTPIFACGPAKPPPPLPVTVVPAPPPPAVASAEPAPPPPPFDSAAACAAAAKTTRDEFQRLVNEGADPDIFDPDNLTACTPFERGAATITLGREGSLVKVPGFGQACIGTRLELSHFEPEGPAPPVELSDNIHCYYRASVTVADLGKDGRAELVVEETGLEMAGVVLQRLAHIDRARIFERRDGALVPYGPLAAFTSFVESVGASKFEATQPTIVLTSTMDLEDAAGPALLYEVMRIRLADCGLREWLGCTHMPGVKLLARPRRAADGIVTYPLLHELSREEREEVSTVTCEAPPDEPGAAAATAVLKAFCAMTTAKTPKRPPASFWSKARRAHCKDPARCFYFDEAEHAMARWAEVLGAPKPAQP